METNECLNGSNNSDMDLAIQEDTNSLDNLEPYYSDIPAQVEKNLEFIAANKYGHILLGCSNLTGRYWCGSVWYYTDSLLAPDIEGSKAALEFQGGVTDCAFIDDKRAIVGQDGGVISYLTIKETEDSTQIEKVEQIEDHGYAVVSVKVNCSGKNAITASMDMSIRVWDCYTTACTHNFTPAHTQEVTSIAPHSNHPELFLSSSLDGNVFLWDLRAPKPASCIFRDLDNCPTAVSWVSSSLSDTPYYLVGTADGTIHLRDQKTISYSLGTIQPFRRSLFRISPNKFRPNQFVACANETKVQVVSIEGESMSITYCDDSHDDFVRGVEWLSESKFVSCGWDKKIYHHTLTD